MKRLTFVLMFLCTFVCVAGAKDVITGECGPKVTYRVDLKAKKLTLTGNGRMYEYSDKAPWYKYSSEITTLEFVGDIAITKELHDGLTVLENIVGSGMKRYTVEDNCVLTMDGTLVMGCGSSVIPSSTKAIGRNAFRKCTTLTAVDIPSGVQSIEDFAFVGCTALSSVSIPATVREIGNGAFGRCTTLAKVSILSPELSIGMGVFSGCSALTTVSIASETVGKFAFRGCSSLSEVTMLPSVKHIADGAFYECKSLANVEIPSSVVSIGSGAFAHCTALSKVSISSEPDMGIGAFEGCSSLPVDNHIRYADKWAVDLDDINQQSYAVRSGTVGISGGLFSACRSLTEVTIPSGVRVMGEKVFTRCPSLRRISVADTIPHLSAKAFAGVDCAKVDAAGISGSYWYMHGATACLDSLIAWAQTDKEALYAAEKPASFPGGDNLFEKWIEMHVKYPSVCAEKCVEGTVEVKFVVGPDGCISDPEVAASPDDNLSQEVMRIVKIMPNWNPAKVGGKAVRSVADISVTFRHDGHVYSLTHRPSEPAPTESYGIAHFPGGDKELARFLVKNIAFPEVASADGSEMLGVRFKVGDDGSIYDVEVDSTVSKVFADELVRVVGLMPKWERRVESDERVQSYVGSFAVMFPFKDESDILAEETNASFPGGVEACYKWLLKNIHTPAICKEKGVHGRVLVRFVVDKDGRVVDPQIVSSPDKDLSMEALRVVKLMPKWKPATIGNKKVRKPLRSRFNLPIVFGLY